MIDSTFLPALHDGYQTFDGLAGREVAARNKSFGDRYPETSTERLPKTRLNRQWRRLRWYD